MSQNNSSSSYQLGNSLIWSFHQYPSNKIFLAMSRSIYWRRMLQLRATKGTTMSSQSNMYFVLQNPSSLLKLVSYISNNSITNDERQSLTVSYLINSCGLSPESALSVSNKIQLKSTKNPDSVLKLFRNLGFKETQITKVVFKCPWVLRSNPQKTLLPKFNAFISHGISRRDLARIICCNPRILMSGLNTRIIPGFDFLRSVVHTDKNIAKALRLSESRLLQCNPHAQVAPRISILKNHGVPDPSISKLITNYPRTMFVDQNRFCEIVAFVKEMGFDPSSCSNFILAVNSMACMKKSIWNKKLEVYRSLGLSDDEIYSAFKVQPRCMSRSEKKIKRVADFLLSKMGWKPSVLSKCPNLLCYSLENRTAPRCSVLQLLISKGLIEDSLNLIWALNERETDFENRFLFKYEDTVPEIMRVYEGKVGSINFDSLSKTQTL